MALKLYVSSASPYVSDVCMQVLDSISIASILKYTSGSDNSLKRKTGEKGLDLSRNKREESLWLDGTRLHKRHNVLLYIHKIS